MVLWKLHGDGKHIPPTEVVAPDERLAWPQTIGLGFQHVLAMFGATFLVPLLIGFPPNTTIFFSGIGTLIFLIVTIGRGQRLGLPSYLGSSFAFIAPVIAAKAVGGIPSALAGICIAGAVFFLVGAAVNVWGSGFITWLMPPVVTGAVVALIGLNLAGSAFTNYSKQPLPATVTVVVIILVMVSLRGFLGRLSILIGVLAGYFVTLAQGHIQFRGGQRGRMGRPAAFHGSELHLAADRLDRPRGDRADRREHRAHQGCGHDDRPEPRPLPRTRLYGRWPGDDARRTRWR